MFLFFFSFLSKSVPLCVDLGAENMRATMLTRQGPVLVHTAEGKKYTPSIASIIPNSEDAPVFFTEGDVELLDRFVGDVQLAKRYPKQSVRFISQLLGKNFTRKITSYFKSRMITLPIDEDEENYIEVLQPPEFFAAELLGKAIEDCKRTKVNLTVETLAVVVPKFFTHHQRKAVIRSGKLATIKPRLIDTTEALAYEYAAEKEKVFSKKPQTVMFIDIGASQMQISIQKFSTNKTGKYVEELGYAWADGVGGQAIDAQIGKLIKEELLKLQPNADINIKATENIMEYAKKLKHMLTLQDNVNQTLEDIIPGFDFSFKITRKDLNNAAKKELATLQNCIKSALNSSKIINPQGIDRVELVGGGSRIVNYVKMINKTLDNIVPILRTMNAEEAIVNGAAYVIAGAKKNYLEKQIHFQPLKIYNIVRKKLTEKRFAYFYKEKALPIGINQFIMAVEFLKDTASPEMVNGILVAKQCKKLTKSGLYKDKMYRVNALLTAFEKKERAQAETNAKIHELESYLIETKDKLTKDSYIYKVSTENERKRALRAVANAQYIMETEQVTDEIELKRMKQEVESACAGIIKAAEDAREMPQEILKLKNLLEEVNQAVLEDFEEQGVQLPEDVEIELGKLMKRTEETLKRAEENDPSVSADDVRIALEKLRRQFESAKKHLLSGDATQEL